MSQTVTEALAALGDLASVQEMQALAESGTAPASRPKVNSHIHLPPNFSAFETVTQAVQLAADQNVGVLCASNYYNFEVYGDFVAETRKHNIFPLFGTEIIALIDQLVSDGVKINDPGNPGKMYFCGKGITKFSQLSPRAKELLGSIRENDRKRMAEMISKLAGAFQASGVDTGLTEDKVIDMVVARHDCKRETVTLQERHVAQAFQEAFFEIVPAERRAEKLSQVLGAESQANDAVKIQGEIRSHLMKAGKSCFVEETFCNFEQTRELVCELGGIPCYPTLADGTSPLCQFESPVEDLIGRMKERGVFCAEFVPLRNAPEVLTEYVKAMRDAGIVVTAGTEHNTLDLVAIEPTCVKEQPIPEELKDIFWEGACVVAAHQFMVLNGECGFVDAQGTPNPAYASDEERISAFARLGAAVIEKYYQTNA